MNDRPKNILCAVDFSHFTHPVLAYGKKLSTCFNARLYLLHAVHFASDHIYSSDVLERGGKEQALSARARQEMKKMMAGSDIDWEPVVVCGDPVEEILHTTEEKAIDLVIAASHGLSGLRRILLGTVVERLARMLSRPLLVIRPPMRRNDDRATVPPDIGKILVGCNMRSPTNPALGFATTLAEHLSADLHLLHAVEAPVDENIVDPTQGPYSEVQSRLTRRLHRRLDDLISQDTKQRLNVWTTVTEGLPGEVLSAHATAIDADLIVVGVPERNIIGKLFVGSTIESTLRHAPCPVLTIPHPATDGQRIGDRP